MRLRHARVLLLSLALCAIIIGILAFHDPLRFSIDIGSGFDSPFVAGMEGPLPDAPFTYRWTNGQALVRIAGVSGRYPLTVSFRTTDDLRPAYETSRPLTLTISSDGNTVFQEALAPLGRWYSFTVPPPASHTLNLVFATRAWNAQNGMVRRGMSLAALTVVPAVIPPPFADLEWWPVLLFALVVVLLAALGLASGIWRGSLLGLVGLAGGGTLLWLDRPLFALYAPMLALGLGLLFLLFRFVRPRPQWMVGLLFGGTLALYLCFISGQIISDDDLIKYYVTDGLLTRHSLIFTPLFGPSGYTRYGLGHILAEAPFLALGKLVEALRGAPLDRLLQFSVTLMNPLVSALLVLLIYSTAQLLYANRRVALMLALIGALATIIFPYALLTATEPLLGLLLLAAIYCALRYFRAAPDDHPGIWLARAGLTVGALALTKQEYVLFGLLIVGWWLLRARLAQGATMRQLLYQFAWLIGPMLLAVAEIISINLARGLDILGTADAPQVFTAPDIGATLAGMYGALFSVGKSIFLFSLPLLLLPFALPRFVRQRPWDAGLWLTLTAGALLFYGRLSFWAGDLSYGDRYMLPFTALLLLPLGAIMPQLGHWGRRALALLCALGLAVQALGVLVDFSTAFFFISAPQANSFAQLYRLWEFEPRYAELTMHTQALLAGRIRSQAVTQLSYFGLPGFSDWLVPGGLLAMIIYAAVWLYRLGWGSDDYAVGVFRPRSCEATKSRPAIFAGPPGAEGEI